MNNKQAKRVGVMWPKAYNSELRKPVMKLEGPLFLFKKLTHLVFATEELANSCGQGLVQKKKATTTTITRQSSFRSRKS